MKTQELITQIREILPSESYGLKYALLGDLYQVPREGICVIRDRQNPKKGWDCADSALHLHALLEAQGKQVHICGGESSDEIQKVHFFVQDSEGLTYDAVPLYKTVGENHKAYENFSPNDPRLNTHLLSISRFLVPLTWYPEDKEDYLVAASTQLSYLSPETHGKLKANLFAVKRKKGICTTCAEVVIILDQQKYRKTGHTPLSIYTNEKAQERIQELQKNKLVQIVSAQVWPEILPTIPNDIKEKMWQNLDVLCSILERQITATPASKLP